MTDDPLDAMKARWNHIQGYLFPWLREDVDPMTEALGRLVTTLDVIGLEAFVPEPPRGAGRPPDDRRALARAFVAKAVLGVPTTTALIERLDVDKSLRRILGWERRSQVPSEATFSRAFAEFAQGDLPDKMHAALIERSLGGRIVGVIARDATEIEAREKPVKTEQNDKKEDPPPPDGAQPTRKRGRASFRGISTPSLTAQGEQRRSSIFMPSQSTRRKPSPRTRILLTPQRRHSMSATPAWRFSTSSGTSQPCLSG